MKGRTPNITALLGAPDKVPPAPSWLPKFAKTEWARGRAAANASVSGSYENEKRADGLLFA
jgi:hypothetical protein